MSISRVSWTDDDGSGTTGTIINQAQLTAIYDSLETSWPWVTYTPTWVGSGGNPAIVNGTLSGRYFKIGKLVFVDIFVQMGGSTTFGSGTWSWALPVTAADTNGQVLNAYLLDNGSNGYHRPALVASTTVLTIADVPSGLGINPTTPFTWVSGDEIRISGFFVAA
jgi:hypothetical protein